MDGAFPSQKGQYFESYPGGAGSYGRGRGFRGSAENAKTKLCNRWLQGDCSFGDRCNFAHGEQELRALPPRDSNGSLPPPAAARGGYVGRGRGPSYGYGGRGPGGPSAPYGSQVGRGRGYDGYYPGGGYGGGQQGGYPGSYGMDHRSQAAPYGQMMGPGPGREAPSQSFNQGIPGPNGWIAYRSPENEVYFHNSGTGATQWEAPSEWHNPPK